MSRKTYYSLFLQAAALAVMLLLSSSATHGQVSGGVDRNTSQMAQDQNECAIAKNPANKLQLFVMCNNVTGGLFAARSTDGGLTWTYPDPSKTIANGINAALGPAACCDPALAWDSFGNLYLTYLDANVTNVVTLLSKDGGQTFSTLVTFGPFCGSCVDQPTVTAANTTVVGAPVAVWIVWHQNPSAGPMVASGAAVTGLGAIGAFSAAQNIPGTGDCSYGDVAIAPSGAVVNVCQTPSSGDSPAPTTKMLVNTKPDGLGPNPFNAAVTATTTNVGAFHPIPPQNNRTVDAEPGLAYDRNVASPHYKRLYLVYTSEAVFHSGDTDIQVRYSDDDGGTWSPPIRVNDDATNRSQFLPRIASNPLSGNIAVCWHDDRNSAANTAMEEFCTIATPSGPSPTFMANAQIGDGPSTSNGAGVEFGDYSGLAYFQGLGHPSWADTSNSTGDNPNGTANFDAYTDRVTGGAAAHEGDPHLTTVNGVHYDFQGAGEFIVLRDYDGLEIQTRQSPIATTFNPGPDAHDGLATCVSLNTAVAARVGKHRVTYEPNLNGVPDPSGLQLRVDGILKTLGPAGINLGGGGRIARTSAPGGLEVDFPDDSVMFVTPNWWASQSKWYINVDMSQTPALEGVLGVIPQISWLPNLPDGSSMGPMPGPMNQRYDDLYHKFADAWRVKNKTSLFDYAPGTSTDTFTMKSWPLENPPCVLPETKPVQPGSQLVAEEACRLVGEGPRHSDCLFDVLVTGNPGFAKTYVVSQRVLADSTRTTVSDDKNPTRHDEAVTFTATVVRLAGKGVPTGKVEFMVGGRMVGKPIKLNANGQAEWKTAKLEPGKHEVSAKYTPSSGSAFLPSSSPELVQVVKGRDHDGDHDKY